MPSAIAFPTSTAPGLSYDEAAFKIAWLVREGLARQVTGVALKDESGDDGRSGSNRPTAGLTNTAHSRHYPALDPIWPGSRACEKGADLLNRSGDFPYVFKG